MTPEFRFQPPVEFFLEIRKSYLILFYRADDYQFALAVFVFLVLFAASRSIYLIDEWAFLRGRVPLLLWFATILLNLLLALATLPAA